MVGTQYYNIGGKSDDNITTGIREKSIEQLAIRCTHTVVIQFMSKLFVFYFSTVIFAKICQMTHDVQWHNLLPWQGGGIGSVDDWDLQYLSTKRATTMAYFRILLHISLQIS